MRHSEIAQSPSQGGTAGQNAVWFCRIGCNIIGVVEGNTFIYTNTIPLGGDNITSDIAYVFNITEEEADRLKKQYGLALKSFIDNDTDIILNTYKGEERTKTIKSSELIEVIEARVEEMFSLVMLY